MGDKQKRFDISYLKMAQIWGDMSYCSRRQVGSILVKDDMIISDGYNGTPSKTFENVCEDINGDTHWFVLHAEANAILKCAKHGISCDGATMYQTHSPCKDCSKLILQSGIKRVVFIENYKDTSGIDFLISNGVEVIQIEVLS